MVVKKRALVVMAALLIIGVAMSAGCGGDAADAGGKAELTSALSSFELSAGAMTQALAAGADESVAAKIKGAKADLKEKWQDVMSAAKKLKWTGKAEGEQAWTNLEHAIDSLADNATVATANAALTPSLDMLMTVEGQLWALAQGGE